MTALLALLAADFQLALLPPDARDVPPDAVQGAAEAMAGALPQPFSALPSLAALRAHLEVAGPSCRRDPVCVCSAGPLEAGAAALDLAVEPAPVGNTWAVDLRYLVPCQNQLLDRRAALVERDKAALARYVAEATGAMLRGRDLPQLRYSARGPVPAPGLGLEAERSTTAAAQPARAGALPAQGELRSPPVPAETLYDKYLRHGVESLSKGDYLSAMEDFTHALAEKITPEALIGRGNSALRLERGFDALIDYEEAYRLAPDLARPLLGMAEANRLMGKRAAAVRWYEAYLRSSAPDVTEPLRQLARRRAEALRKD